MIMVAATGSNTLGARSILAVAVPAPAPVAQLAVSVTSPEAIEEISLKQVEAVRATGLFLPEPLRPFGEAEYRRLLGNEYILGAVGVLQFDVIISRLKDEYAVDAVYTPVNLSAARWIEAADKTLQERLQKDLHASLATDSEGNLALLVDSAWRLEYIMEQWPDITFHATREKN